MSGPTQALHPGIIGTAMRGPSPLRLGARAAAVGRRLAAAWHAWRSQSRGRVALNDYELRDIGLTRADVRAQTETTFWRV